MRPLLVVLILVLASVALAQERVEWTLTDPLEVCALRDVLRRRGEAQEALRKVDAELAEVTSRVWAAHGIHADALSPDFRPDGTCVLHVQSKRP